MTLLKYTKGIKTFMRKRECKNNCVSPSVSCFAPNALFVLGKQNEHRAY